MQTIKTFVTVINDTEVDRCNIRCFNDIELAIDYLYNAYLVRLKMVADVLDDVERWSIR